METIAISAARWAVGKALSPVSDGLLESWAASSKLGPNIRALKLELLYAQGMLNNARGRDIHNPALGQLLLELSQQAYDADDVLDELEYFRVQDELDGTYETTDTNTQGPVGGLILNTRHTAGAVVSKLKLPSCSCASVVCPHYRKPKLKFDRVAISKRMVEIVEQLKPLCAKVSTILDLELQGTIASTGSSAQQVSAFSQTTRNTTPQIIEPKLYGRDDFKKEVIDRITAEYGDNDGLTVLSIVGPGGLGKTTLTQHIYEEAKSHFQVLVWVCVSQNFSANRLAQEIVKQIPELDNENKNEIAEDLIEKRLQSKRFLLVLDDMWSDHENEWKKLVAPFKKVQTNERPEVETLVVQRSADLAMPGERCPLVLLALAFTLGVSLGVARRGDASCSSVQGGEVQAQASLQGLESTEEVRDFDPMSVEVEVRQALSEMVSMVDLSPFGCAPSSTPPASPARDVVEVLDQAAEQDWWSGLVEMELAVQPPLCITPARPPTSSPAVGSGVAAAMTTSSVDVDGGRSMQEELEAPVVVAVAGSVDDGLDFVVEEEGTGVAPPTSDAVDGVRSIQEELEAEVCLPLQTPILRTRPRLRRSRTPVAINSLRRSGRIAARPRAANAVRQAQNTLLKKLGEPVQESAPDAEVVSKFRAAFGGNLTERKKQAMQIVLNGEFDLSALDLDLTGLEEEVVLRHA